MAEESKRVALLVFLFFIFIFLAVIIFVFSYSSYRQTKNYTTETTKTSLECSSYSFRIVGGSISYENSTLSFIIDPTLGGSSVKNSLIITVAGEDIETQPIDFTFKQKIKLQTEEPGSFEVYPKGCKDLLKLCDSRTNRCE